LCDGLRLKPSHKDDLKYTTTLTCKQLYGKAPRDAKTHKDLIAQFWQEAAEGEEEDQL
jgi:hypothetical protein